MQRRKLHHLDVEVRPVGVVPFDQSDLPVAPPALQLLLEMDGLRDVAETLEVDKAVHAISLREAGSLPRPVLGDAPLQRVGDADVERAFALPRKDVDPVGAVLSHLAILPTGVIPGPTNCNV